MALRHLWNAIELLRAGMDISDIRTIISLPDDGIETAAGDDAGTGDDVPETDTETETENVAAAAADSHPEQEGSAEIGPDPAPRSPYKRPAENIAAHDTLIADLNKLF